MKLKIGSLIALSLILSLCSSFAQKSYLQLYSTPQIKFKKSFINESALSTYLSQKIKDYKQKGYAEASIDSLLASNDTSFAYMHLGDKYYWDQLKFDSIPYELISSLYGKIKRIEGAPFNARESRKLGDDIVRFYENTGYPFARVNFDSVLINENKVQEKITLIKGPLIKIDSISIKGTAKINPYVVYRLIAIKPESIYSEKKLQSISSNLSNVPYLESSKAQEFYFTENKNILFLYLNEHKSNRFSGILGFQNDPATSKLILTGDLTLGLKNVFKQGEWINFNWNRFQNASQKLFINLGFPYIFKSPVGIETSLSLFKQDTTYIDVSLEGALLFSLSNTSRFEFSVSSRQSNSLSAVPVNSNTFANVSLINYSLGIRHLGYDYIPNPRKGLAAYSKLTVSNKKITNQLEGDTINTDPVQYQAILNLNYFIPTFKKQSLGLFLKLGAIFNEHIFQNEMFRLGGLSTIRGFNEESIFASSYGIGTVEYRYLYEKNANIRLFSDIGLIKNQNYSPDFGLYIGFGIGASLETKAGIFNIDYAMGKQENQILQLSDAKVHIGYLNNF